ncbi:MAG: PD-(D/E)XK nuclease domain-containing protein, partial [Muribaculaceae bacterium]
DFPYELVKRNEAHYQDVIYCITKLLGFYVQAEYRTSSGRADMILGTKEAVYVFEFKLDAGADAAMSQIDAKEYALPFAADASSKWPSASRRRPATSPTGKY